MISILKEFFGFVEELKPKTHTTKNAEILGKIYLMQTEITPTNLDKNFLMVAFLLKKLGHDVTFVTCSCHPGFKDFNIIKVGAWIRSNIYGYMDFLLDFLRTVYLSIWIVIRRKRLMPLAVICNCHPIACLLLSTLGNLNVTYFEYYTEMAELNKTVTKKKDLLYRITLNYADVILVPNKISRTLLLKSIPKVSRTITVLYPGLDLTPKLIQNDEVIPINKIIRNFPLTNATRIFTAIGEYCQRSNFDLAIEAFAIMMDKLQSWPERDRRHLVIAGFCNEEISEHCNYYDKLVTLAKEVGYECHITFLKSLPDNYKKTLILRSVALLHTELNDVFNRPIMEYMAMGKVVIACNSGVPAELILYRITGFLLPPKPILFAKVMRFLSDKPFFAGSMEYLCLLDFQYRFSKTMFTIQFHLLITRSYEIKNNKIKVSEIKPISKTFLIHPKRSCRNMMGLLETVRLENILHPEILKVVVDLEQFIRAKANEIKVPEDDYEYNDGDYVRLIKLSRHLQVELYSAESDDPIDYVTQILWRKKNRLSRFSRLGHWCV